MTVKETHSGHFSLPSLAVAGQRVAYVNARLLDPATGLDVVGGVLTEGDRIVDMGAGLFANGTPDNVEVVDCEGLCLAPGLVDMHVHFREPGQEYKETLATGSKSAVAGGFTAVACMPNTDPVIDTPNIVDYLHQRAKDKAYLRVHTFGAITKGLKGEQLSEMGLMREAGAVGFTDDGRPVMNAMVMRRALEYASAFDVIVSQHCEDLNLSGKGAMNESPTATELGLPGIPNAAETIMVERDIRLLEITGGRYHVAHISAADAVDVVRQAKKRGLKVTCEATPHHFVLTDEDVGGYDTFAKMAPPLRSSADKEAVRQGLIDGTIDAIATDHAPHDPESKEVPFCCAANGIVGMETALPLALELYHDGSMPLLNVLATLTYKPADLLGVPYGRLQKGALADMVLFNPDEEWVVDIRRFHSKCRNSPFEGRVVRGAVHRTVVGGCTVYAK